MYNMENVIEKGGSPMLLLEKMAHRRITSANYITSVNGMVHPDRILAEHDFLYMLDGEWELIEDGHIYEMHRDDLLILSAGRHHRGEKLCNPGNRHMYFHVLPTAAETGEKNDMEEMESSKFLPCHTLLHCRHHPHIRMYFEELISVFWSDSPEKLCRLSLLFNLLLCEIAELHTVSGDRQPSDPLVEEVCRQIQSNPQTFYTAGEMAEAHFICARTLNNRFRKACQKTFYAYQMETRLEMAGHFLTHQPEATLHEAAVNFGFYDEFHLSRAFKKHFKVSPSQFRKSHAVGRTSPLP